MARIEIVDLTDEARFELIPPCADSSFDHRTCDYWEDAQKGSKANRPNWLPAGAAGSGDRSSASREPANPFAPALKTDVNPFLPAPKVASNPFAPPPSAPVRNPFLEDLSGP